MTMMPEPKVVTVGYFLGQKREPPSLLGDVRCWSYGFAYVPLLSSLPENQGEMSILVVYNLEQSRKEAISTMAAREGQKQ